MSEHLLAMERMYEIEKEVERSEDNLKKELFGEVSEPAIKFCETKIKILDAMVAYRLQNADFVIKFNPSG